VGRVSGMRGARAVSENPVMTFPTKKRNNTELFFDIKA